MEDEKARSTSALGSLKKTVLILSSAGKPIYCQGLNEEDMTDVVAAAQAIVSVAKSKGESLRAMRYECSCVWMAYCSGSQLACVWVWCSTLCHLLFNSTRVSRARPHGSIRRDPCTTTRCRCCKCIMSSCICHYEL